MLEDRPALTVGAKEQPTPITTHPYKEVLPLLRIGDTMPITDWGAHVSWLRGKPLRWWAYNTTQVVLYLLLASVPVALEKWSQSRSEGGEGGSDSGGILSLPFRYSWFTHPGFAQTEPQVVQLVTYGEKDAGGELVSESCQRRKLLMRIIQAVQTQKVRLIVLDFSFAPTRCDINPQLEHVIRTSSVPLVIGLRTEEADERTDGEALLQPSEAMIQDDTGVVKRGLLRLNSDTRKIPLEWPMRVNMRTEEGTIERFPTLSLVAATQFIAMKYGNPERLPPRLTRQLESGTHPYASFLPRGSIPTTSALKLLCGDGPVENWKNCALPRDQRLSGMPIVVVGEESSRDEHYLSEDAIGAESRSNHRSGLPKKVYGVWLQANYIENLVQGSYLKS